MSYIPHVAIDFGSSEGRLSQLLMTGFIPLDITAAREIAANATQNLVAHGGQMASDSTPALQRVNGATDKGLRLAWAAADVTEIAFPPIPKPPDMDTSQPVTVHLLAAMEDANDTPTIDVQAFDGVGDTEMGSATAAVTGTDVDEYSATLAAANLAAAPGVLNIALVPAAHGTDALYLYGAWVEYTRKAG